MNPFEWNKILGAALFSLLIFMVVTIVGDEIFHQETGEVAGMDAAEPEDTLEVVVEGPSFDELLVNASVSSGERSFTKCQACHTANQGGRHQIGPNLWNVVGRTVAGLGDYAYSSALLAIGGTWDYQTLNDFLSSPSQAAPGTKMSFAGIRTEEERANLIVYLRLQADSPLALPAIQSAPEEDVSPQETETGTE